MKNTFFKISAFLTAAMSLAGNMPGNNSESQKAPKESKEISEETPLYLDEATQFTKSTTISNLFASHSSHSSHSSHQSHYSHYSGR